VSVLMTLGTGRPAQGGGGWHERVEHKQECVLDLFLHGCMEVICGTKDTLVRSSAIPQAATNGSVDSVLCALPPRGWPKAGQTVWWRGRR